MPDANIDLLEALDAASILVSLPECMPDNAYKQAILARVRDIVSRGKVAVFTRPHRILDGLPVIKRVTNPEPNDLGDLASDNGYVAPWDEAYTLTEGDPE